MATISKRPHTQNRRTELARGPIRNVEAPENGPVSFSVFGPRHRLVVSLSWEDLDRLHALAKGHRELAAGLEELPDGGLRDHREELANESAAREE